MNKVYVVTAEYHFKKTRLKQACDEMVFAHHGLLWGSGTINGPHKIIEHTECYATKQLAERALKRLNVGNFKKNYGIEDAEFKVRAFDLDTKQFVDE